MREITTLLASGKLMQQDCLNNGKKFRRSFKDLQITEENNVVLRRFFDYEIIGFNANA